MIAATVLLFLLVASPLGTRAGDVPINLRDEIRPGLDQASAGVDSSSMLHATECRAPGGFMLADESQCTCCPGYFGTGCAMRDRCHEQICLNGGTCESLTGACRCTEGFLGDHCEVPDCGVHGSFDPFRGVCVCRRGWDGYQCSQCALPTRADREYVCVPAHNADYLLLEVGADVASDLLAGHTVGAIEQSYPTILPTSGKGTRGHDNRYYGCDCRPVDEMRNAREAHRAMMMLARDPRISAADLGAFDTVISDCIADSNLTAQQMQELNELWDRCLEQERRGRLNDTWYILGIIFIILTIALLIGIVITCFLWSYQLDRLRMLGVTSQVDLPPAQRLGRRVKPHRGGRRKKMHSHAGAHNSRGPMVIATSGRR